MKKYSVFAIAAIVIIAGYLIKYPLFNKPQIDADKEEARIHAEEKTHLLFSVVLDNAPEARPQAGLGEAEIVFEAPAEGSATRLLAFFSDKADVPKIGPVRSARPYFLDWAAGFDLPFVHSGGSREALAQIQSNSQVRDINEFANEHYFWRDKARRAPHNLYTSSKLMKELIERKGWAGSSLSFPSAAAEESSPRSESRARLDPLSAAGMTENLVNQISVNFSTPNFAVDYKYDAADNSYARFLAAKPDQDIKAKNIVVLHTTSSLIDKKLLTIDLETAGSGKVVVFRDGQMVQARWRKQGNTSPLELLDADGTQIELNPGQTWIEVLDQRGSVEWK